jgi:putative endonuclease
MTNQPPSYYPDLGALGEDLVAQWLESCGWMLLHRRWRCRGGEIDVIAEFLRSDGEGESTLAFVEVKTRSARNWDSGGRYAIAFPKQQRIWRTAEQFLAKYPQKADYTCRFDVAIVYSERITNNKIVNHIDSNLATTSVMGYYLTLQEYIPAAFDSL